MDVRPNLCHSRGRSRAAFCKVNRDILLVSKSMQAATHRVPSPLWGRLQLESRSAYRSPPRTAEKRQNGGLFCGVRAHDTRDDVAVLGGGLRLDVAGDLAAALDLQLAVADRARHPAARLDQQPLADGQIAFEAALDFGFLDRGGALEQPALGDLDVAAIVEVGLDAALDDQLVAGGDFAREGDLAADGQFADVAVIAPLLGRRVAWTANRLGRANRH